MSRNWLIRIRGDKPQQHIAAQCGISQNFYSWIEWGERNPSKKIAAVLGFDWTLFFEDADEDPQSA